MISSGFKFSSKNQQEMAGCCAILSRWLSLLLYVSGIGLSSYAYYVEVAKEADEKYVALCDINEDISCSRVFSSKYGKGFGLVGPFLGQDHVLNQPNALYGIGFYSILTLLFICGGSSKFLAYIQFYSFSIASGLSCYLAYILYFVLKDICVVCIATYAVNFLLLLLSYCKKRSLRKRAPAPIMQSSYGRNEPTLPSFDFKKNI